MTAAVLAVTYALVAAAAWQAGRRRPDPPPAPRWTPTHPAAPRPPLYDWAAEVDL